MEMISEQYYHVWEMLI